MPAAMRRAVEWRRRAPVHYACGDVPALDAEFLCLHGHKVYGATGIGVLYGPKKAWLDKLGPFGRRDGEM